MKAKNFSRLRRLTAAIIFGLFLALFAFGAAPLPRLAHFQAGPALLGGGIVFLCLLALSALCFGRVYCAALCPLGICQDAIGRIFKKTRRKPLSRSLWPRLLVLALYLGAFAGGSLFLFGLLDPYSVFGRMASALFAPVAAWAGNLAALGAEAVGASAPYRAAPPVPGWPVLLAAALTLLALFALVWKFGRVWCNYCPVGTALGLLGKKSLFRMRLDGEKCVGCRRCEKTCKTGCIDLDRLKNGKGDPVDNSLCVACLNCADVCPRDALSYALPRAREADPQKREALKTLIPLAALGVLLGSEAQAADTREINRPDVMPERKKPASRTTPLVPPGSASLEHFRAHCTGCRICVGVCPNRTLGAADAGVLQPALGYEYGYCRPNCVKCGEVCPTGAIAPISRQEKAALRIGLAVVDHTRCITRTEKDVCTACMRICPNGAIALVQGAAGEDGPPAPQVDAEKCTGCGACEYICAARPLAAIRVEGLAAHERI